MGNPPLVNAQFALFGHFPPEVGEGFMKTTFAIEVQILEDWEAGELFGGFRPEGSLLEGQKGKTTHHPEDKLQASLTLPKATAPGTFKPRLRACPKKPPGSTSGPPLFSERNPRIDF